MYGRMKTSLHDAGICLPRDVGREIPVCDKIAAHLITCLRLRLLRDFIVIRYAVRDRRVHKFFSHCGGCLCITLFSHKIVSIHLCLNIFLIKLGIKES